MDPVILGVWLISSLQLGSRECPQVRRGAGGAAGQRGAPPGEERGRGGSWAAGSAPR